MRNALILIALSFLPALVLAEPLRYIPIGDSYTSGDGIRAADNFPHQLAAALGNVTLTANPAHGGWTSAQAIKLELPIFEKAKPQFATLLIGVNDWVQGVPTLEFQRNLQVLMDRMIAALPSRRRLIVLTVPDFGASFSGGQFAMGRDISAGITALNAIIRAEAAKRHLVCVDILAISQAAKGKPELFAPDGLHPSAAQYTQWVDLIVPVAKAGLLPSLLGEGSSGRSTSKRRP